MNTDPMSLDAARRPGAVPDEAADEVTDGVGPDRPDVRWGTDTDDDGRPDTVLTADGADLLVLTDLDDDGFADRMLRIGADGSVHATAAPSGDSWQAVPAVEAHQGGGPVTGSAAAVPGPWSALLGRLFGIDP